MKILPLLRSLLFITQVLHAQTTFTKPSEAYEFAHRALTERDEAFRAHKLPPTPIASEADFRKHANELCPAFQVESVSGEELYWLAKLCEGNPAKALPAVERYLAGSELAHAADARLVLAVAEMQTGGGREAAWGTFEIILRGDPYEPVESQLDVVIDTESDTNAAKALEWSKERYGILVERNRTEKPGVPPVHASSVMSAGADLAHRYYLAGQNDEAARLLGELNAFGKSHPEAAESWGAEDLYWVNMEMKPAPAIAVLKEFGGKSGPDLIQKGRVEVISFFFLGCGPCVFEMPRLNELQNRYGKEKLLVADVTSYEVGSRYAYSTNSKTDADVEKARQENAPDIDFVISTDKTLGSYVVHGFPVVLFVDKSGRVRFVGREISFRDEESTGRLIRKLMEE